MRCKLAVKVLAGVGLAAFDAEILICSPVLGFLPLLVCLVLTEKIANPVTVIGSPLLRALFSVSMAVSKTLPIRERYPYLRQLSQSVPVAPMNSPFLTGTLYAEAHWRFCQNVAEWRDSRQSWGG